MKKMLSQKEIDEVIEFSANDDNAWGEWVSANPCRPISIRLSEKTIGSLKVLSKLRKEKGYQTLLKKWIDERLIYEQSILKEVRSLL